MGLLLLLFFPFFLLILSKRLPCVIYWFFEGFYLWCAAWLLPIIACRSPKAWDECPRCWLWLWLSDSCVWPHGLWPLFPCSSLPVVAAWDAKKQLRDVETWHCCNLIYRVCGCRLVRQAEQLEWSTSLSLWIALLWLSNKHLPAIFLTRIISTSMVIQCRLRHWWVLQ